MRVSWTDGAAQPGPMKQGGEDLDEGAALLQFLASDMMMMVISSSSSTYILLLLCRAPLNDGEALLHFLCQRHDVYGSIMVVLCTPLVPLGLRF